MKGDLLKIVYWPNKSLRLPAFPVARSRFGSQNLSNFCQDLAKTMHAYGGVGIAAPQVGSRSQIFLISEEVIPDYSLDVEGAKVFINPTLVDTSKNTNKDLEGCLSFPNIFLQVERPNRCLLQAKDLDGNVFSFEAQNFLARAVLHEYGHLRGELMVDFVSQLRKNMVKKKIKKWRETHGL